MRKLVAGLVLALAGTLTVTAPAHAGAARWVSLKAPTVRTVGQTVVLQGRVAGRAKVVRIDRKAGTRWVKVRKVRVSHGRYSLAIHPAVRTTRYRAAALSTSSTTYSAARTVKVVSAAKPRPPVSSDACGVRPAKADGSLWACTFADDFSGTTLDRTKWMPQTQFTSGVQAAHACYLDDPSVISQSNGALNLTLRKVETPVSCSFGGSRQPSSYVSGSVMTYHLFSQQYGRFEARIKNAASGVPGLHEAFWLWPDDRVASTAVWPVAGEIDIAETYSSHPNLAIPFLHYSADAYGPVPGTNTAWNCTAYRGVWNTYTLEWSASRLEIKVNGKTCLVNTSGDQAFQKPYIMALTQLMGASGNEYDGRAPLPATMNVDYVRVWK
ncbi:MAG: glycoside hydrolase family 16 protein [Nocardioidaceae bacterium]|nr:glycoside hydrolase family 16 protein [Nocardioidaceae bacterium]